MKTLVIGPLQLTLVIIQPSESSQRVDAAMNPLEDLARAKVEERRKEILEGKRTDSRDLLSLMRNFQDFHSRRCEC